MLLHKIAVIIREMKKKILILLMFLAFLVPAYGEQDNIKHVLIIHSYDPSYQWTANINNGLLSTINEPHIKVYTEYLDLLRQSYTEDYLKYIEALFLYKYKNFRFDLIIVTDDYALDYVLKKRELFFKDTPIVFCGINEFNLSMIKGQKNITGVNEHMSIQENIELAFSLSKNPKKIAVIAGTRIPEIKNLESFKKYIKAYEDRVKVLYLNNLELDEMANELSRLDSNDVVFHLSYLRSPKGILYESDYVIEYLSNATSAKFFVLQDHLIKFNVLGGKVISGVAHGEEAGKMALMILNGKKADQIPVKMESPNRYMFNGKLLLKHKISKLELPKGSIIINETLEQLKEGWVERIKNSAFDYNLFKNHGTVMLIIDPETGFIIDANNSAYEYYGYERLTEKKITEINTLTHEQVKEEMQKAKEQRRNFFNFRHRLANGMIRDVEVYSYPIKLGDRPLLFSIIFDVTDRIALERENQKRQRFIILSLTLISILSAFVVLISLYYLKKKKEYADELLEKNRSLEKAKEEIKVLSGIIPICSHCKKIRDDKGYWSQLEKFISERSEVLFSHSICPTCYKKYYESSESDFKK